MISFKLSTLSLLLCVLLTSCGGDETGSTAQIPPTGEIPGEPPINPPEDVVPPEKEILKLISLSGGQDSHYPENLTLKFETNQTVEQIKKFRLCQRTFIDGEIGDLTCSNTDVTLVDGLHQVSTRQPLTKYDQNYFYIQNPDTLLGGYTMKLMTPYIANDLTQYIKASVPKKDEQFGWSISINADGNTMAIGTNTAGLGSVYIFTHDGKKWIEKSTLNTAEKTENDAYGKALSLSGDGKTLAVSAELSNRVYLYTLNAEEWIENGFITGSASTKDDAFGFSVDINHDGSEIIVGAPFEGTTEKLKTGAVYTFLKTDGNYIQNQRLQGSKLQKGDEFGYSVKISPNGEVIAVGAWKDDMNYQGELNPDTNANIGAVYLFSKINSSWEEDKYLKSNTGAINDLFGKSLSLDSSGIVLAIGAPSTGLKTGAAYVSKKVGSAWQDAIAIPHPNLKPGDNYGATVALNPAGNYLAVSSLFDQSNAIGIHGVTENFTVPNSGAVRLFKLKDSTWKETIFIKAPASDAMDLFGQAITWPKFGEKVVITSIGESSSVAGLNGDKLDNSLPNSGAVFVY